MSNMYVRTKYKWRVTASGLLAPPATVVITNGRIDPENPDGPRLEPKIPQKGRATRLGPEELVWIGRNNTAQEARYLLKDHSGWVNAYPNAESVDFGGNVFEALRIGANYTEVKALKQGDLLPPVEDYLLSHLFTAVTPLNQPRLAGAGLTCFFPAIINGDAWILNSWLEFFSEKPLPNWPGGTPKDLSGYPVVVLKGTVVRQSPNGVKIFVVAVDLVTRVISEVNGWAKIGDKRWVPLDRTRKV